MEQHVPQGRHSMDIVRVATSFHVPSWLFKSFEIFPFELSIFNSKKLSLLVHDAILKEVCLDRVYPTFRSLAGEWVTDRNNSITETVILYLHGGYISLHHFIFKSAYFHVPTVSSDLDIENRKGLLLPSLCVGLSSCTRSQIS